MVDDVQRVAKLPAQTPLPPAADEAFDRIAQLVRTVLGVPVALVSLVDQTRQVFPGAAGLPDPWQSERTTPLSHSFCQHVVLTEAPLVLADARLDPLVADNLAIPELGVVAYAGIPLVDLDGRVAGSLCAIDLQPREWTAADQQLLSDLAAACSAELQLRESVTKASAAAARARLLLDLSEALSVTTTVADVSLTVSQVATSRLGAQFGGVTLLDERAGALTYVDLSGLPPAARDLGSIALTDDRPSSMALRLQRPLFFEDIDDLTAVSPGSREAAVATGGQSFAYLPLQLGPLPLGPLPLGTLALAWAAPRTFTADDRELLGGLAQYTAQAVDRAVLLAERRETARTLQESLLPSLPEVAWAELAGLYRPAHEADAVGGDWYDAFRAGTDGGDDPLTVVVGDVTGHDMAAAAIMGQLQWSLRSLAADAVDPPGRLLQRLDQVIARIGASRLATAVLATLTMAEDRSIDLAWSNAGHLPPVLLAPGAPAVYLERPVDPLLGLFEPMARGNHSVPLPAGATVVLFTDGLVERRDTGLQAGLDALLVAVTRHRDLALPDLLTAVLDEVLADGHDDDTVLLGIRARA